MDLNLKRLPETTVINNGVVWDILSDLDAKLHDQKVVLAQLLEVLPLCNGDSATLLWRI